MDKNDTHPPNKCPAFAKSCNNCGKKNHYSKCGRHTVSMNKKVHTMEKETGELFVDCLLRDDDVMEVSEDTGDDEWIVPIIMNDTIMLFKLDTGAQANLMSESDYGQLTVKSKIHPARTRVLRRREGSS